MHIPSIWVVIVALVLGKALSFRRCSSSRKCTQAIEFNTASTLSSCCSKTMLKSTMNSYNSAEFKQLIKRAVAWCGLNGLMYTDGVLNWSHAPIAMIPNTFSKSAFMYSTDLQTTLNELIDCISRDREFILSQLSSVAESDEFIANLLSIYKQIPDETLQSGLQFGILRSDYMVSS